MNTCVHGYGAVNKRPSVTLLRQVDYLLEHEREWGVVATNALHGRLQRQKAFLLDGG